MTSLTPRRGQPLTRDESFFFSNIFICVEDTLFSVPRELLVVPGSHFAIEASTLPSEISQDRPLVIEGVSKHTFKNLLRCLYPSINGDTPLEDDQLLEVLNLATMWNMQNVRLKVIATLESEPDTIEAAPPIDQIIWGHSYKVKTWFHRGLIALIQSDSHNRLPYEKLIERGLRAETLVKLMSFREYYLARRLEGYSDDGLKGVTCPPALAVACAGCLKFCGSPYQRMTLSETIESYIRPFFAAEMTKTLDIRQTYCDACLDGASDSNFGGKQEASADDDL